MVKAFTIPCKKFVGLVDVKGRQRRGIVERLNIAFANNSTNGDISALQEEIEGVGVGCLLLDSMRPRLQPLAMKHHLSSLRVFKEIPDLCKPK